MILSSFRFHLILIYLAKLSGIYFFKVCPFRYPVPFIIHFIINKDFIIFVSYIVYFKYITSKKILDKSGFLLNLISELQNMFLSNMSF